MTHLEAETQRRSLFLSSYASAKHASLVEAVPWWNCLEPTGKSRKNVSWRNIFPQPVNGTDHFCSHCTGETLDSWPHLMAREQKDLVQLCVQVQCIWWEGYCFHHKCEDQMNLLPKIILNCSSCLSSHSYFFIQATITSCLDFSHGWFWCLLDYLPSSTFSRPGYCKVVFLHWLGTLLQESLTPFSFFSFHLT